jgi:DNA-binding transcriptional LysR family regulator
MSVARHASLRQLQVFAEVARRSNMSRAAEALNVTQPAVSLAVKELEQAADTPLVEMLGRRLRLTEAGREVARAAAEVAARLRELDEALAALGGSRRGTLDVFVVSTAKYFVPTLLTHFCARLPQVEVKLRVDNRDKVLAALENYDCDLVVMGTPPRELDCESRPFATNPLGIIAPVAHALSRRRQLEVADLKDELFLVREIGSGTRASMDRFFRAHRFTPSRSFEIGSNETIKQATIAGMGVAFVSLRTVQHEVAGGRLAVLAVDGLPIVRNWHVVHLKKRRLSPVAAEFKAFLVAEGRGLVELA